MCPSILNQLTATVDPFLPTPPVNITIMQSYRAIAPKSRVNIGMKYHI